ncbi:MAG: Adenine phosphoribosyltransferase [Nitrosopumilales archaeon]|nr:MAG: Adenine phosphoribosyltransferase [Nitrosopumilales archaeon]
MNLKEKINEYHDFPKKGILFRDFSPILKDPSALSYVIDELSKHFHTKNIDLFVGIESRGFLLASAMAVRYNKGMIMIRKAGKLPGKTVKQSYSTEYGKDTIEIQNNSITKGDRILICDDLLATGGTAKATGKLIEKMGGKITGFAFIIELTELNGIKEISKYNCKSLVKY